MSLALWRVLILNKWHRFAQPDKHTPKLNKQTKRLIEQIGLFYATKTQTKAVVEIDRGIAANPLGELPLFLLTAGLTAFVFSLFLCRFLFLKYKKAVFETAFDENKKSQTQTKLFGFGF